MTPLAAAPSAPALPPFRAIADLLREHAADRPGQPALLQGGRSLSWAALDALVDRVAAALQHGGVQPTQSIAICAANSIAYVAVFLGALRAGVAVAPLPTGSLPAQLAGMTADCGARLLFVDADTPAFESAAPRIRLDGDGGDALQAWLAPAGARPAAVAIDPQWAFNIIYSSGTTGTPKGIVQPHAMRWAHVARAANYGYGPDSVTLVATSLCSNTTLVSVFPALAMGGAVALSQGRFDPVAYLALAERVRATHAMLVPVQYQRLMACPEFGRFDLGSFRMKFCTSSPFSAALKRDVLARWPGGLIEYYGMTEGGGTCILEAHLHPDKLHTVGKPAEGHDIRLIDEEGRELPPSTGAGQAPGATGEVVGRSLAMMTGYHAQPGKTREAEWYDGEGRRYIRTGDVGRFDADGFLTLLDRRKDMIISGGFNIYPSDIEAVLREHSAVADAAVVGAPSETWGESPVAFVVARPGADAPDAQALRDWANARLGKTQRLADLCFLPELPRSDIGKVLKRQLREQYASRA
jgi:acyl-CoA synthetase (AMP-forming)/AMP-acid ligase II